MGLSSGLAFAGIVLRRNFFFATEVLSDHLAVRFAGLHRILLNKYYVDEIYTRPSSGPIRRMSERVLWNVVDVGIIGRRR